MANVIRKATNKFTKGLVMDFSPENTKNEVLTHALNATLLTFNGNELSLQNDMGNARVKTAYLPEGYMPVGTCEYGGIIYIVSYNPLENKSLIGCFPSPERNISNDELGESDKWLKNTDFLGEDGTINNTSLYVLLKNTNLNPGDKFIVYSNSTIYENNLKDLLVKLDETFKIKDNPIIALNVVSIENNGKITYLNSTVRLYESQSGNTYYNYHILGSDKYTDTSNLKQIDLDQYRNVISSGYNVFKSKTSGKLAILAELLTIDSFSVTHSIQTKEDDFGTSYDVFLHIDVEPKVTQDNYNVIPKLAYYYLENSQGYLLTLNANEEISNVPLFNYDEINKAYEISKLFLDITLESVYTIIDNSFDYANKISLANSGKFNFPFPKTYHTGLEAVKDVLGEKFYTKFTQNEHYSVNKKLLKAGLDYYEKLGAKFLTKNEGEISYTLVNFDKDLIDESKVYYTKETGYIYEKDNRYTRLKPSSTESNNIELDIIEIVPIYKIKNQYVKIPEKYTGEKYKQVDVYKYTKYIRTGGLMNYLELYVKRDNGTYGLTYDVYTELYPENINNSETLILENTNFELNDTIIENPDNLKFPIIIPEGGEILDPNHNNFITWAQSQDLYERTLEKALLSVEENGDSAETYYCYLPPLEYEKITTEDFKINTYYDTEMYPLEENEPYGYPYIVYTRKESVDESTYRIIKDLDLVKAWINKLALFTSDEYTYIDKSKIVELEELEEFYISFSKDVYLDNDTFNPQNVLNFEIYEQTPFIPTTDNVSYDNNLKLANIKMPLPVTAMGVDLPFKYDYTIVPCMNYGKLHNLAVSNTIDFGKLRSFKDSNFNVWKYRIDGNLLKLTFGAEIYDTYKQEKVNGLILEFYDNVGFAGSIEISEKRSYSGIFTKIIDLNSLNAISNKKVIKKGEEYSEEYSEGYKHNINISYDVDTYNYSLNLKNITYKDDDNGWELDENKDINDCGTLYSNLVYGVKTYLRVGSGNSLKFIRKKDLFLYTFPIYNDYYYTINDFNSLENPLLDLVLTYNIKDSSIKQDFVDNDRSILEGYITTDKNNIDSYVKGEIDQNSFNVVKYYKYKGNSLVQLEIGLKEDYSQFNISYDPSINNYFGCTLKLMSDVSLGTSYSLQEGTFNDLQYPYGLLDLSINKVNFSLELLEDTSPQLDNFEINITKDDFYKYNFLTKEPSKTLNIEYEFVAGYKIFINDIKDVYIPSTTICALCHKNNDGVYNYEDFGVYEVLNEDGNKYYSNAMVYNEGNSLEYTVGICKLVEEKGTIMKLCHSLDSFTTLPKIIRSAGKLNVGDSIKNLNKYIGKLTFCLPHVHGLSESNGVNIYVNKNKAGEIIGYGIPLYKRYSLIDEGKEDTYGMVPAGAFNDKKEGIVEPSDFYKDPIYNLSLNTKNSILYQSEFISTVESGVIDLLEINIFNYGDNDKATDEAKGAKAFIGLNGEQLAEFNKYLVATMKSIYAYNPDYNQTKVKVGDVTLQNPKVMFISNLMSYKSSLDLPKGQSFNTFIFINNLRFSTYLKHLLDFSKLEIITDDKSVPLISFVPNLTYCGDDEFYLLSKLSYKLPKPDELILLLSFNSNDTIVVKHLDGTSEIIYGVPNLKALYAWDSDKRHMIELDVENYTIDSTSGELLLKELDEESTEVFIPCTNKSNKYSLFGVTNGNISYQINKGYENKCFALTSLTINDLIYEPAVDGHRLFIKENCYKYYSNPNSFIYYRSLDIDIAKTKYDWHHSYVTPLNRLHLFTGPCFIPNNGL